MYSCNSKITLIVAAAGVGKRMGLGYPKQFLEVDGKPLFIKTLEVAEKTQSIEKIIIVTNEENVDLVKELTEKFGISKIENVIPGGSERQYSIENALKLCEENEIIAVQDGVRPNLKEKYFTEALEKLERDLSLDGIVIGVKLKDTIKKVDENGIVIETPKREEYIAVHTPQIFRGKILKEAYNRAREEEFLGTDDSSLVERIGGKVGLILGDYDNIKITTVEDLKQI